MFFSFVGGLLTYGENTRLCWINCHSDHKFCTDSPSQIIGIQLSDLSSMNSMNCFNAICRRRKDKSLAKTIQEVGEDFSSIQNVTFYSYKELRNATENFHPDNKIGVGGFGAVYKGTLKDGTLVAVKSLSAESKQGVREFLTEIALISDVKHENLVQLHGCCVEGSHRILVYGYLENKSIAQTLLDAENTRINFDWPTRAKICIGTACGLAYLHEEVEPHIVHRDIKASNILLDKDMNPKIADFGLAKLFPDNMTHITTRVAGTIGYLAPEYAMRGHLTKRADIYSFGVLVLEIISGRSNTNSSLPAEEQFLLEWTWQLHEENRLLQLVDPRLEGEFPEEEILQFIKVALLCTQAAANSRPAMSEVVLMLSKERDFPEKQLTRPGFISDLTKLKIGVTHRSPNSPFTALQQKVPSASSSSTNLTVTPNSMFSS